MKLLLHICCGPCSMYPVDVMRDKSIDFTGIFYNPNIHPIDEFVKRKENLKIASEIKKFEVIYFDDFEQEIWENFFDEDKRCNMCYEKRLQFTAKYAKENGYDGFTTTLLVSPYQKHEFIKELCEKLSREYLIEFFYDDFRTGFRKGQQQAKELGIYRQKYCGCIKSLKIK